MIGWPLVGDEAGEYLLVRHLVFHWICVKIIIVNETSSLKLIFYNYCIYKNSLTKSTFHLLGWFVHRIHCWIVWIHFIVLYFGFHIHVLWRINHLLRNLVVLTVFSLILLVCKCFSLLCWKSMINLEHTSMLVLVLFPSNYSTQDQEYICAFQSLVFFLCQLDSFSGIIWLIYHWDHNVQVLGFLGSKLQEIRFWEWFFQLKMLERDLRHWVFHFYTKQDLEFSNFRQEVFSQIFWK